MAPSTMTTAQQIVHVLGTMTYEHLPEHLQGASQPFCDLARNLAEDYDPEHTPEGAAFELLQSLLMLRRAKDHAVLAQLAL